MKVKLVTSTSRFNEVMNKHKINSISNLGVSILELIREHRPASDIELRQIFNDKAIYPFGVYVSQFADACEKEGVKYTNTEIYNYLFDIFFTKSFNGFKAEKKVLEVLEELGYSARFACKEEDCKYGVDIVLSSGIGIQVKPMSYLRISNEKHEEQIKKNIEKNKQYEKENNTHVFMFFYDDLDGINKDNVFFKNLKEGKILGNS